MYGSTFAELFDRDAVEETQEFRRILALPRRTWSTKDLERLADQLTEILRTPHGTMRLRPIQGLALHDAGVCGGMFGPQRVGAGKTLVFLLMPLFLDSKRPVGLLPAALVQKTVDEQRKYAEHFKIPKSMMLVSYEELGRVAAANKLENYMPDAFVLDEAHRIKNPRAAVTRRVARYMHNHPETKFVAMSGTIMKRSLNDFGPILRWCLKDNAPIPATEGETEEWADALDERVHALQRRDPGALISLAAPEDIVAEDSLATARRGFCRRLVETPGVVATADEDVSCSLYVRALEYNVAPVVDEYFEKLRRDWLTPDGWELMEAVSIWRHARELAIGMHYVWDPRPPEEWMRRRKVWASFVRTTLAASRTLDTELQVAQACIRGDLGNAEFNGWREVRDTYTPVPKAVWHDDSALLVCQQWAEEAPGIIWCEHTFFAEELAKRTGLIYYGGEGLSEQGDYIGDADPQKPLIASIAANSTGRNLQAWSRNLITAPPMGAAAWEQLLGRTHRDGQTADEVVVDVLMACREHWDGWVRARAEAEAAKDLLGGSQKLLLADTVFPVDMANRFGARWAKSGSKSL